MKTINQLREEINQLREKINHSDFISAIQEKRDGNLENFNKYKDLEAQLKEAEKEENKTNLTKNVNLFNASVDKVYQIFDKMKDFKGNILKADGSHTKKFSEFLKTIETDLNIYATCRPYSNETEIKIRDLKNTFYIYEKEGIYTMAEYKKVSISEMINARRAHNEFLKELKALEDKISDNYCIASGNYYFEEYNKKNTFKDI